MMKYIKLGVVAPGRTSCNNCFFPICFLDEIMNIFSVEKFRLKILYISHKVCLSSSES